MMTVEGPPALFVPATALQVSRDVEAALAFVRRFPHLVAAGFATSGCVLFAAATTFVGLLHLPALLLAVPWALSLSSFAMAFCVARYARRRAGTGGMDVEIERRILEVAIAHGGRLTTTAVAHELSIPLREADAALTALAKASYLAIETHPASGALVYVFPEIDAGLVPAKTSAIGDDRMALVRHTAPPPASAGQVGTPMSIVRVSSKSRVTTALLAICGGSFGAHKFYLGEPIAGITQFVLMWTLLPAIAGLYEGLRYLLMSDHAFDLKYNARVM